MTAAAAMTERERWLVVGGGVLAFALVHAGMAGMLRPSTFGDGASFAYAPHARLLLLPFGAMPYDAAVAIWSALNLFCLFRAAELMSPRRDLALLACVSPAALTMLVSGYAGGFLALLATSVLVQGHRRPGLAGLNLALMTVHPPLALLLGLLLLLLGHRRAVSLAVPWTLALLAASVITFGPEPWASYWSAPASIADRSAISLHAAVRASGLPGWTAQAIHWGFGFAALVGAVLVFLRRGPEPRSIALLLLAVVLALPDGRSDGLAVAVPALTLALFAASPADERPLLPFAAALLLWTMPVLAAPLGAASGPVAPPALAAILLYALARQGAVPGPAFAADRVRQ